MMATTRRKIAPQTFLAQLPLFQDLGPEELAGIALGTTERAVARGDMIFQRGDICRGFHIVIFGQVKLALGLANGMEKVVELIGPGHSFGEAVMFMDKPYIVTAQALTDCLLLHVDKSAILSQLERDPGFACKMLAGLSRRLHGLMSDMESYSLRNGTQRVIGYLLTDEPPQDGVVHLPVKKAVLASRLNLTPEHFSRILHELCDKGLIALHVRDVTILDLQGLRDYAG